MNAFSGCWAILALHSYHHPLSFAARSMPEQFDPYDTGTYVTEGVLPPVEALDQIGNDLRVFSEAALTLVH